MNDLIEYEDVIAELRDGLGEVRFDREPPRRHSAIRPVAMVPAVAAALVLVMVTQSSGIGDGIAWAAVARPLTPDEQTWITADCAKSIATTEGAWPGTLPDLMTGEVRGNTATLTFAGGEWFTTCVVEELARDDQFDPGLSVIHFGYADELPYRDEQIAFSVLGLMSVNLEGTTFVTGTVAPEITRVAIEVNGLGGVEATVANGWFTAWWPSREPFVVRGIGSNNILIVAVTPP